MSYSHPLDLHLKKNALHHTLHVPSGEKIPQDKLKKALSSSNPLTAKRARFAETMRGWNHSGKA